MDYEGLRGQSAIEYLMTYGWMLLVVAVAGGAIFSIVGDQSIESVQGFNSNEIQINDFGMTESSLQINTEVFGANSAKLKEIKLEESSNQNVTIPLNKDIEPGDNAILNLPHLTKTDETNEVQIELIYDTGNLENISTTGSVIGNIELDESLVAYWTLDQSQSNSTHVFDVSGNGQHAEITETKFVEDSERGSVMEFNGENSTIDAVNKKWDSEEITVLMWGKTHIDSGTENDYAVLSTDGGDNDLLFQFTSDRLRFWGRTSPESNTRENYDFNIDQWHYIGVAYEYGEENVEFIADNDRNSGEGDRFGMAGRETFHIGSRRGSSRTFEGRISNLIIFDRVLEDNEISAFYRNLDLVQ